MPSIWNQVDFTYTMQLVLRHINKHSFKSFTRFESVTLVRNMTLKVIYWYKRYWYVWKVYKSLTQVIAFPLCVGLHDQWWVTSKTMLGYTILYLPGEKMCSFLLDRSVLIGSAHCCLRAPLSPAQYLLLLSREPHRCWSCCCHWEAPCPPLRLFVCSALPSSPLGVILAVGVGKVSVKDAHLLYR